jgi:predicted transcriptional regulator
MSQSTLLEILDKTDHVLQCNLQGLTGLNKRSIEKSLKGLEKWGKITRERVSLGKDKGMSYKIVRTQI